MTSTRPYLIRALYEWIVDNQLTPYIVISAEETGVQVPKQYVEAGRIVLNVSPSAAQGLQIGNEWVEFNARFSGVARLVTAPIQAVMAIYARENGRGMVFGEEEEEDDSNGTPPPASPTSAGNGGPHKKPKLTIVK
jgi:stringent starvation protein B